jgi:septum formation protein
MNPQSYPQIILASASPRRLELLGGLKLPFTVIPADVDESFDPKMTPEQVVTSLACLKAEHVAKHKLNGQSSLVIGADTIVVLDGKILGKPNDDDEACAMLKLLAGNCHKVFTGVAIYRPADGKQLVDYAISSVYIRNLEDKEISAYVKTGEPLDKAGSYALQGSGSAFVEKIEGCFTNVIGLPMPLTVKLLRQAGVSIFGLP